MTGVEMSFIGLAIIDASKNGIRILVNIIIGRCFSCVYITDSVDQWFPDRRQKGIIFRSMFRCSRCNVVCRLLKVSPYIIIMQIMFSGPLISLDSI